jgi:Tfp pilus assembly protein PilZ
MEKRECHRFCIPGTTLFYKKTGVLGKNRDYPDEYYPVLDISKGGLRFLTNERPKIGLPVKVKVAVPDAGYQPEIQGVVRWVSRNREKSYRYQTGVSFNAYGDRKKDNPSEILTFIQSLEQEHSSENRTCPESSADQLTRD